MRKAEAQDKALIDPTCYQQLDQPSAVSPAADEPKASARAITLNFITGGLGSAIFSLPWSVAGASVLTSVAIVAAVMLLNFWTIAIVVRAGERYGVFDLGSIVAQLPHGLGRPLQAVTNIFIWAAMFFTLVSYIIVIHDSFSGFVAGTFLDNRFLLVLIAAVLVLPLCFLSQKLLEGTSSLAVLVNVYLFVLIGVLYGLAASGGRLPEGCCLLGSTVRGNFAMITVMFQAVIVQMCVLPMYKALENRSPQKFNRIVAVGFGVLFVLFCGFSSIGYLLSGPKVASNILQDLPKGPPTSVAEASVIAVVASVYPIMVYPMIAPIEAGGSHIFGLSRTGAVSVAKVVIVAASALVAACVTTLGFVNVINGAMSALVFVALLPSVVGLMLLDTGACHKVALWFLLVLGTVLSLMGFVFNENYVGDLHCALAA